MPILILAPAMRTRAWEKQLAICEPGLDLRVWPDTGSLEDVTFALVWNHPPGALGRFPALGCVASMGAGVDAILADPELPDVPIVRIVDPSLSRSMAEYLLLAVLGWIRQMDRYREDQPRRRWRPRIPRSPADVRVGIMGLGQLGAHAAAAFQRMGFVVSGWSRTPKTLAGVDTFCGPEERDRFLSDLDVLVCLLPLTDRTRGILNREVFGKLPQGAFLVNTARGGHLVEKDLLAALDTGQLAGACLDVFRTEPLPEDHPFWAHPKIAVTPHISSLTNPKAVCPQIIDNYRRLKTGRPLRNLVERGRGY